MKFGKHSYQTKKVDSGRVSGKVTKRSEAHRKNDSGMGMGNSSKKKGRNGNY